MSLQKLCDNEISINVVEIKSVRKNSSYIYIARDLSSVTRFVLLRNVYSGRNRIRNEVRIVLILSVAVDKVGDYLGEIESRAFVEFPTELERHFEVDVLRVHYIVIYTLIEYYLYRINGIYIRLNETESYLSLLISVESYLDHTADTVVSIVDTRGNRSVVGYYVIDDIHYLSHRIVRAVYERKNGLDELTGDGYRSAVRVENYGETSLEFSEKLGDIYSAFFRRSFAVRRTVALSEADDVVQCGSTAEERVEVKTACLYRSDIDETAEIRVQFAVRTVDIYRDYVVLAFDLAIGIVGVLRNLVNFEIRFDRSKVRNVDIRLEVELVDTVQELRYGNIQTFVSFKERTENSVDYSVESIISFAVITAERKIGYTRNIYAEYRLVIIVITVLILYRLDDIAFRKRKFETAELDLSAVTRACVPLDLRLKNETERIFVFCYLYNAVRMIAGYVTDHIRMVDGKTYIRLGKTRQVVCAEQFYYEREEVLLESQNGIER